jgi:homocitrate synthase
MITIDRDYVVGKYNLKKLKDIETLVARAVEVNIPFNNPITGYSAFTHKAGIHAKAILNNPSTYEILNPADFGLSRYVHFASRLTGWNAIKSRCEQLGMPMTDEQYKECTAKIKALADVRKLAVDDTDSIISAYHANLHGEDRPLMEGLSAEEKKLLDWEGSNVVNGAKNGVENGNGHINGQKKRKVENGDGHVNGQKKRKVEA